MSKIFSMKELNTTTTNNPFEMFGVEDKDYVTLDDILNIPVDVYAIKAFENDKGPGVFLLINGIEARDDYKYVCTHSITITSKFTTDKVNEVLAEGSGQAIRGMFIQRKSKKSDRMVYDFE
jgi:hypothetical protein